MATTIQNNDPASNITPMPQKSSGGIIAQAQMGSSTPPVTTQYNGQTVYTDKGQMDRLAAGAENYNKATNKSLSVQDYDKMLNPTTYGARWGIPAPVSGVTQGGEKAGTPTSAASYSAATVADPTKLNVTSDQTVAGQMRGLIDPNNPYYQQWQTAGLQAANARGLSNSSIAQTGILDSVMRGATPIATADAATYAKAAGYNADEANQFALANQNALNSQYAFNTGQANSLTSTKYTADKSADTQLAVADKNNQTSLASTKYTADKSADTQLAVTDKNNQTALAQSGISAETQKIIAQMNNQSQSAVSAAHDANANLIQSNQQAQAAYNSYVAAVAQIDQNKDMDATAKATAIARQTQIFNSSITGLKAQAPNTSDIGSPLDASAPSGAAEQVGGVDVSSLLDFG